MSSDVKPFLCPPQDTLQLEPWLHQVEDQWEKLPEALPTWDYQTDLTLARDILVHVDRVRSEAHLPPHAQLAVVVEWRSSESKLTGVACKALVDDQGSVCLRGRLQGGHLGGTLQLATRLVLVESFDPPDPFIAHRAGDVLLEETSYVRLQGHATMFPVTAVDFAALGLDEGARWHVRMPQDLAQSTMGGLRLYINARDADLLEAVQAGSSRPEYQHLLEYLHVDVGRQLVESALAPDVLAVLDEQSEDPESFGGTLQRLLRNLFGDEPPDVLAAQRATDPSFFATRLQAALIRSARRWEPS